jgi:putative two-component system hydrogenase maturation factor HypX/HoxX
MKITLLITTFNSLSQKVYSYLKDSGFDVSVVYAINKEQMIREIDTILPDLVFSPFLKKYIPKEIFENYPTFVLHPGPKGDRGAYSLENVIYHDKKEWGVVILKVDEKLDGGDIYKEVSFEVKSPYKASVYRNELSDSALNATKEFFDSFKTKKPTPQLKLPMHKKLSTENIKIDCQNDTTKEILIKINTLDSFPWV